jgi:membrane dipeptidase
MASMGGLASLSIIKQVWSVDSIELKDDISEIYNKSVVIDCLASPASFNVNWPPIGPLSKTQLENAASSGITAVNLSLEENSFENTIRNIALWQGEIDTHPTQLLHIRRARDLEQAKKESKLGLIFGFQDLECIGRDLTLLEVFYKLGVRIIQLTYNTANLFGVGCLEQRDGGLTKLGRKAVAELNKLGIAVDLSHCGSHTTLDGIAISEKPIIISHSGCKEIYRHPRSKEEKELRAMADKGGVIGIYFVFLGNDGTPYCNKDMLLDHIDHALRVCGSDHVGIGSDLSITPVEETPEYIKALKEDDAKRAKLGIQAPDEAGRPPYMPELNTPRRLEKVALAMSKRGHSEDVIEKVIGGNFRRVFEEIW